MNALLFSWAGSVNSPIIFETHFDAKWSKQRVAYVSNAKDFLPEGKRDREIISSIDRIKNSVKSVTKFDLYDQTDNFTIQYFIDNFDVIYVGGGMMSPLIKAVNETGFDQLLLSLDSTDIKYVGSSAGSMLLSNTMKVAGWYPGEEEPEIADEAGIGLVPFEIFPHYSEAEHLDIIKENAIKPIILLPDNSAVGLEGGELRFYNQARLLL